MKPLTISIVTGLVLAGGFHGSTAGAQDNVVTGAFAPNTLREKHLAGETISAVLWQIAVQDPRKTYVDPATSSVSLKPGSDDMLAKFYPIMAANDSVSGGARVECQFHADGSLYNCIALAEVPLHYTFGLAAQKFVPKVYQIDVAKAHAQADHDWIMLTVTWTMS